MLQKVDVRFHTHNRWVVDVKETDVCLVYSLIDDSQSLEDDDDGSEEGGHLLFARLCTQPHLA